jgi:PAS domain S-box-containing protein
MTAEVLNAKPLRLLLVEDNPDDAALLERHLRRNGFSLKSARVETAAEMTAALAEEPPPDLVIADYNLPNFSGPAALQMVKASGLDIPFIMMSGAISEETAVESMRAGAQDYVTKQNLARLAPVLDRELREASARRQRNAAEVALRASQARFHRLADAMPLGLLISDSTGRILYANAAVERLLGYPSGSMLADGETIQTLCPALEKTYANQEQGSIVAEPFETVCRTAAGEQIEVLLGVAQLNPEAADEDRQVAAFIADLTLQKKSEEMLRRTEKLAVAGRLAASVAHEINNPLEAITNCLYLVGKTELPADARTYLLLAQDELDRVAQITVQTLRFYRRSTLASSTNLHELIETVLALLQSRMKRQDIAVVREFGEIPLLVLHDGEIRQVLANLVGNAIDALPQGGTITLRTARSRDWKTGNVGIRISVADDGTGMSAATLKRIFEPFFSTKGITGTGLGLWVSREIVDKHHGHLQARSRERLEGIEGGTVFSLFLPTEMVQTVLPAEEPEVVSRGVEGHVI